MSRTCLIPIALLSAALACPALAQETGYWRGTLMAGTDNRRQNESWSDGDPFVGAAAEWTSTSGLFYAGPGIETIDDHGSPFELNAVAGVRPYVQGFDLNFSLAYRWRADTNSGIDDDEIELTADASRSIGPASARLRVQYSPDGGSRADQATWVEARLGWDLTPRLNASGAVGRRERQGGVDYTGWNLGVAYDLTDRAQIDVRYHGTDADSQGREWDDGVVAAVLFDF